jgi:MYB-related transcription factor LHY
MVKKKVPKDGSHKAEKWTSEEHQQFIEAVRAHGKNWTKVAEMIPTRDRPAIASHSQQFRKKCHKDPNIEGSDLL